ncbi:hypothetical protein [Nocardia tenerifensis]|uniref:hypothetical protein n=1 Tax=Nocardia tenerifensis TaxID=228006 RepID=UPI0002FBBC4E|nr:hypothetical protein [Nocardia tenerifensis]
MAPRAKIEPRRPRQWIPAAEMVEALIRLGPDTTGWRDELREMLSQTTDELPR